MKTVNKTFFLGIMVSLLLMISISKIMERPLYDTTIPTNANDSWDFSTGLSLSSTMASRNSKILSFGVSSTIIRSKGDGYVEQMSNSMFVRGIYSFYGIIKPEKQPVTYQLNGSLESYSLDVSYSTIFQYDDENTLIKAADLGPLSYGIATILNTDKALQELSRDEFNQGIYDKSVVNAQVFSIKHLYTDGSIIRIQMIDNNVYIEYSFIDYLEFVGGGYCECYYPETNPISSYYHIQLDNFDIIPYIYAVNEVILGEF